MLIILTKVQTVSFSSYNQRCLCAEFLWPLRLGWLLVSVSIRCIIFYKIMDTSFLLSKYGVIFSEFDCIGRVGADAVLLYSKLYIIMFQSAVQFHVRCTDAFLGGLLWLVFTVILLFDVAFVWDASYNYRKSGREWFDGTRISLKCSFSVNTYTFSHCFCYV